MFKTLLLYAPISIVGVWRWTYWVIRLVGASLYKPKYTTWPKSKPKPTVSVVTPVYNEEEKLFKLAMTSWIENGVSEIVAVIDKSNPHLISEFERLYSKHPTVACKLVVTPKPGKRAALCDGIGRTKGDMIALVDSDTVWGPSVIDKALPLFLEQNIGAVTVPQRISNPNTTSNILFDILLWTRYREEVPFLLGLGKAFNTLSGRTALYRRDAILNPEHDNVHLLRHEFFVRTRGVSGDDKRLTHLILEQGWHIGFVKGAVVYTQGMDKMRLFLKQRLRWTRNSWRADLRAVKRGWVWRHPALAFFMIDRFIQPFFMLIGPVAFVLAAIAGEWLIAGILIAWWIVSRLIKLFGYFRKYPKRIVYLPAYIVYSYLNAVMKIYALATIFEHSWATRWHKSRLRKGKGLLRRYSTIGLGGVVVIMFIAGITVMVSRINQETAISINVPPPVSINEFNEKRVSTADIPAVPPMPAGAILPTGVKVYIVRDGDTMTGISQKLGVSVLDLKKINQIQNSSKINVGQTILYYEMPALAEVQQ